jgi:hypothetical protein
VEMAAKRKFLRRCLFEILPQFLYYDEQTFQSFDNVFRNSGAKQVLPKGCLRHSLRSELKK